MFVQAAAPAPWWPCQVGRTGCPSTCAVRCCLLPLLQGLQLDVEAALEHVLRRTDIDPTKASFGHPAAELAFCHCPALTGFPSNRLPENASHNPHPVCLPSSLQPSSLHPPGRAVWAFAGRRGCGVRRSANAAPPGRCVHALTPDLREPLLQAITCKTVCFFATLMMCICRGVCPGLLLASRALWPTLLR